MQKMKKKYPAIVLGGKHAIPYRILYMAAPILTITVPLAEWLTAEDSQVFNWLIAAAVGSFCTFIACVLADKTYFKNRQKNPVSNLKIFFLGFYLGAIKGFSTGIFASEILNVRNITLEDTFKRSFSAAVLGLFIFPVLSFASYAWERFTSYKKFSQEKLTSLGEIAFSNEDAQDKLEVMNQVKMRLARMKSDFMEAMNENGANNRVGLALILDHLARDAVRPLSHEIVKKARYSLRFSGVINYLTLLPVVLNQSIPWIVSLCNLFQVSYVLRNNGFTQALSIIAINVMILIGCLYALQFAILKGKFKYKFNIFLVFLFLAIDALLQALVYQAITDNFRFARLAIVFVLCLFITYFVLFMNMFVTFHSEIITTTDQTYMNEFDKLLRKSNIKSDLSHEVARFLHGTLQTRISASAFRFRNTDSTEFDYEFECQQVLKHFDLEEELLSLAKNEKLREQMIDLLNFWGSMLDCRYEMDVDETKLNEICLKRVIDLINESLSNALRHGNAKSIQIQLIDSFSDILVVVTNDGAPIRSISRGLGSSLFDELTNTRWEIQNLSDGTGVRFSALVSRN